MNQNGLIYYQIQVLSETPGGRAEAALGFFS